MTSAGGSIDAGHLCIGSTTIRGRDDRRLGRTRRGRVDRPRHSRDRPVARGNGWRLPDGVTELEKAFLNCARWVDAWPSVDIDGQTTLLLDAPVAQVHDVIVKLVLTYREGGCVAGHITQVGAATRQLRRTSDGHGWRIGAVSLWLISTRTSAALVSSMRDTIETKGVPA